MERRNFFTAGLAVLSLAAYAGMGSPVQAQSLSLNQLSNYLNKLKTAKGGFTQVNPDGTLSKGVFYLARPGRMRFEYSKPNNSLVVAGGRQLAVFDKKSNNGPQQYPLSKTPLSIILKRRVDLRSSGMVTWHTSDGVKTTVVAQDPKHPKSGNIQLVFTANPIQLRQWIVTDESGRKTTVILGKLDTGIPLKSSLFNIKQITDDLGQGE